MSNDASPRGKFWDILTSISKDIPRISTDFITPDGIDYKKLIGQITHINAKKLLPLATTPMMPSSLVKMLIILLLSL